MNQASRQRGPGRPKLYVQPRQYVAFTAEQLADLRHLAHQHGRTLADEIRLAVDAHRARAHTEEAMTA